MPNIDSNPSDENYIYSKLLNIRDQAKKLRVEVLSVTFDQPLWQKSVGVIEEADLRIVCRLGGFQMIMSFLGSIGNFMKGSGIEGLFIEVHAESTVNHTMSRRAFSRALHTHFLTEAVLVTLLLKKIFDSHVIEAKIFKEQLTEDFENSDIANKEVFLEVELCSYENGKQKK